MANEITLTLQLKCSKNGLGVDSVSPGGVPNSSHTMTGDDSASFSQVVTQAADVAITIPASIGTVGFLLIENKDGTNYIELSNATGGSFAGGKFAKIRAGCRALIQPTGTIYGKANTADCRVKVTVIEE